jgi:hypothetical protein
VTGTWIWEDGDAECRESPQTFEFTADRTGMTITIGPPTSSATEYVVEGVGTNVLHTRIIDESRLTDAGVPVKWDLVVVAPDVLAWHRTDWRPDGTSPRLVRCAQRAASGRA